MELTLAVGAVPADVLNGPVRGELHLVLLICLVEGDGPAAMALGILDAADVLVVDRELECQGNLALLVRIVKGGGDGAAGGCCPTGS